MIFNDFQDKKLSALGMGCMRLPQKSESYADIDIDATKAMVKFAIENGINYFDTAWGYHDSMSETVMGEVLKDYPRDSFFLASKFPGYDLSLMDKVEEIFEKQLEKCQVDYFDFYLFHNVCEMNIDGYLDPKFKIFDYLTEQKRNGRIRHLGFSAHGNLDTMKRFLDAYGKDMEFCQLQINWIDWEFQNAKEKVDLVRSYGDIPIWVMEPVRGGSLVSLKPEYEEKLRELRPNVSNAEWAFRFVQSLPEVKMTLSGMSNFDQLKENIDTYQKAEPLNETEMNTLIKIGRLMTGKNLPCTACKYCVTHCPQGLDIPWIIELYNEHVYSNGGFIAPMAMSALGEDKLPSACLACGACEAVCPQTIKISEMMADFAEKLKQ